MASEDDGGATEALLDGLRALGDDLPFNRHLGARVDALAPGRAVTVLDGRETLQNHLGGTHAVAALAPVELAGALAVTSRLAEVLERGHVPVVGELTARYLAPAHGRLTATAEVGEEVVAPALAALSEGRKPRADVTVVVRDAAGQEVLEARLTFLFVPMPGQDGADGPTGRPG